MHGRADYFLVAAFLLVLAMPVLFICRFLDDNTLTSWRWVFASPPVWKFLPLILTGMGAAFFIARIPIPERLQYPLLFLFSSLAVTPLWQEPEVIIDASRYIMQAKQLALSGPAGFLSEWGREISAWTDMPVVPFSYGLIFFYLGESRLYIQAFNTLLFGATAVFTALIGRTLWDRETGLLGGLLLSGIPYLLIQAPLLLVDVPAMFLFTLSLCTFLQAIGKGSAPWMAAAPFSLFLAAFSKFSVSLMLIVLPIAVFAYRAGRLRERLVRACVVLSAFAVLAAFPAIMKHDLLSEQVRLLKTFQVPALGRWGEGLVSTFLFQAHPFILFAAIAGTVAALKKRDSRFLITGYFAAFILLFQVWRIRYILPLFPLFTLMAAYGLCLFKDQALSRFVSLGAVSTSLVIAYAGFLPFLCRTSSQNLKEAGAYMDTLRCRSALVYAIPQPASRGSTAAAVPVLDLFTNKDLVYPAAWSVPGPAGRDSPLRFTGEVPLADFYRRGLTDSPVVAVISGERVAALPEEVRGHMPDDSLLREFTVSSGVFRYKTFVTVFGKDCP